ncbi:hypothetical protein C8J57DRAFT_473169 [Mycena rebaudengoi]|nr:hypothetical protein C8J57DRAFT_473169 [Mycena rebaudengoi]
MNSPEQPHALLLVYTEPLADLSLEQLNAWQREFRVMPAGNGIHPGRRYKAIDQQQPTYLAFQEASSPELVQEGHVSSSGSDSDAMSKFAMLNRRVYTLESSRAHPNITDIPAAQIIYFFSADILPAAEDSFLEWYDGEHTERFSTIPGWLRVRRYKLHSSEELGSTGKPPLQYLAVHEWSHAGFMDSPEYASLVVAPKAAEMKKVLLGVEIRVFELDM